MTKPTTNELIDFLNWRAQNARTERQRTMLRHARDRLESVQRRCEELELGLRTMESVLRRDTVEVLTRSALDKLVLDMHLFVEALLKKE